MYFLDYKKFYSEDGTFDLKSYRYAGHRIADLIGEIVILLLFAAFYTWGIINLVQFFQHFKTDVDALIGTLQAVGIVELLYENGWQIAVAFIAVYIITLGVNYLIVRFFSKFAAFFMYGSGILQIAMFGLIFYYMGTLDSVLGGWWVRYLFLIPIVLQLVVMVVWYKKFALAIEYTKMSCLVVWKERKLIIPQLLQTFWIFSLMFFQIIVTINTFFGVTDDTTNIYLGPKASFDISSTYLYIGYTVGFFLLTYAVIYVTLSMKINMVHHWYRGSNLSFWHAITIARRRWWATMMYAAVSTVIHSIKWVRKILKGEIDPKNIFDAVKQTFDMLPENPMALEPFGRQKRQAKRKASKGVQFGLRARLRWRRQFRKEVPLYKRIWIALNYFTLPAISIEDKPFFLALPRSLQTIVRNIPDLYIKHSNVNKLFKFTKIASIGLSMMLGATIGWVLGYIGQNTDLLPDLYSKTTLVIVFAILFGVVGSISSLLVLNDLNMSYVTLMYIHTIDDLHGKKGYTRFDLEPHDQIEARVNKKKEKRDRRRSRWGLKPKYKEELDANKELSDFQPELD